MNEITVILIADGTTGDGFNGFWRDFKKIKIVNV